MSRYKGREQNLAGGPPPTGGTPCHHVPAYLEPVYLSRWADGRFLGQTVIARVPLCPAQVERDHFTETCWKVSGGFRAVPEYRHLFTREAWNRLLDARARPPWHLVERDGRLEPEGDRGGEFKMPEPKSVGQDAASGEGAQ